MRDMGTTSVEDATRPLTVVTGGSQGIGLAIAVRRARRGEAVLLVARDADRLRAAAEAIRQATGRTVETLALDLARPEAADRLVSHLAANGRHFALLVNSAGIGLSGAFDAHSPAEIEALLALNVAALTRLMRLALPGMRARRRGAILNIASLGAYVPGPYQAVYYASKAYVVSLSEAVAAEVAADGVRITCLAPGPVATGFHARMGAETALYRHLLPAMQPETVALWADLALGLGARTVAPGIVNCLLLAALRILPHRLSVTIVAWLLKPRGRETRNAGA